GEILSPSAALASARAPCSTVIVSRGGYVMPLVKQVAHTCIFARDLDAVEAFYRDITGVAPKFDFMRGDDRIGFYLDFGNRTFVEVFRKGESRFDETNQINHLCFETDDIDAFMANARSKGVTVTDKKLGVDHTWQCWLADPS